MAKKKKAKSSQPPAKTATTSAVEAVRVDSRLKPKETLPDVSDPPDVEPAIVTPEPKAKKGKRKFRVSLNCPTPLRDKSLVVLANSEGEATKAFLMHNGISGSDHPITVVEV